MAIPVSVVLDRTPYGTGPLDLSGLVAEGSLTWSSVVPGGFASCSFALEGDFTRLVKQVPYLSTLRIVGDSGRVLFEGQIEDLAPVLSEGSASLKVGAYGFQNALKETTVRQAWSVRSIPWGDLTLPYGSSDSGTITRDANVGVTTGAFDTADLTHAGVQCSGAGVSVASGRGNGAEWIPPAGITFNTWLGTLAASGAQSGTSSWTSGWFAIEATNWTFKTSSTLAGTNTFSVALNNAGGVRLLTYNNSGAPATLNVNDRAQFYDMRLLGTSVSEDVSGGFYGDSLINSLLGFVAPVGSGVIESGSDFTIEHLDASVRRTAYDILREIAQYYNREWAVWEDSLLHWRTPQLSQPQWIVPISQMVGLDLDASVQNSQATSYILYTDAGSGRTAEASTASTDRRNPYVLTGRVKDELTDAPFAMTSTTSAQLSTRILNNLGYGPVPAAGSIIVPGETIIQHAQGNAAKAWEIRAGDNITIPELPLTDIFTQDGRGESLFHIVSAEANAQAGTMTFTLDSYGSKRSDVLMARLAAVTQALGG